MTPISHRSLICHMLHTRCVVIPLDWIHTQLSVKLNCESAFSKKLQTIFSCCGNCFFCGKISNNESDSNVKAITYKDVAFLVWMNSFSLFSRARYQVSELLRFVYHVLHPLKPTGYYLNINFQNNGNTIKGHSILCGCVVALFSATVAM